MVGVSEVPVMVEGDTAKSARVCLRGGVERQGVGAGQQPRLLLRGEDHHPGLRFRVVGAGGVGCQRTPFTGTMARAPATANRAATE